MAASSHALTLATVLSCDQTHTVEASLVVPGIEIQILPIVQQLRVGKVLALLIPSPHSDALGDKWTRYDPILPIAEPKFPDKQCLQKSLVTELAGLDEGMTTSSNPMHIHISNALQTIHSQNNIITSQRKQSQSDGELSSLRLPGAIGHLQITEKQPPIYHLDLHRPATPHLWPCHRNRFTDEIVGAPGIHEHQHFLVVNCPLESHCLQWFHTLLCSFRDNTNFSRLVS